MNTIFLSGIDTDAGKTYATAFLIKYLSEKGESVISQKFIQTGNRGYSEDIVRHRLLTGRPLHPRDIDHTTAPIIFTYPASAQLAARIDGKEIDLSVIDDATRRLHEEFSTVIIEGAGGLMVPVTDDFLTIDYITSRNLPLALVTNARLGSINHTVLALEAVKARNIPLPYILFNNHFNSSRLIADDTRRFIRNYVKKHFPDTLFLEFD